MPLASSSLVQIAYAKEATFGVPPVAGGHRFLRVTGESLDFNITKEQSQEINSSRTISSQIPVSASASGGLEAEVSYQEYDTFLESVLQNSYTVYGTAGVSTAITATYTATTLTASAAPTGQSAFTGLKRGQFFRVNAVGSLNHGKILRVSTVTAPTTTVITLDASTPASVESAIAGVTIATSRLTNGSTQSSFTLERRSPDIGEFWAYTGMTPSALTLNMASGSRTTMSLTFMGKDGRRAGATHLPGAATESYGYDIHSGTTGPVCLLLVDGVPLAGTYVNSLSMTYDNALREQMALCELGAVGIGSGTINLTGNMEVYFANGALFDKFKSNTNISLVFSTLDGSGNGYVFSVPKVNISKVGTSAGGKDADMMLSVEWTGLRDLANADPTLRQIAFVDRVGVAAT